VVVRVADTVGWHALRSCWSLPRATVMLAGIAVLPTQPSSISLWSSGAESAIAPTNYGSFAPPIGSADRAWSFAFGWSAVGPMPQTQGSDPAVTALLYGTVSAAAEEFGVGGGGALPALSRAALGGVHAVCGDDQTAMRLQAGGEFWTAHAVSGAPVQFPPDVFTESTLDVTNPLGNPTIGPSGDRSNLPPPGPAGAWCRRLSVPFAQSSPLASRTLWIWVVVLLVMVFVFWLSRGWKMPA
jgi:hypothetical protein